MQNCLTVVLFRRLNIDQTTTRLIYSVRRLQRTPFAGQEMSMGKISARIPDELHSDIRELIPLSGHKDISDLIRDLLREYRDRNQIRLVKKL